MARAPRLRLTPAGRYWLLAVAGFAVTGLTKNINLILLWAYFLAGLFVLNAWLARRSSRGLRAAHAEPLASFAGEALRWRINLQSVNQATTGIEVTTNVCGEALKWTLVVGLPSVAASVRPARRGRHRASAIMASGGFPFGLVDAQMRIGDASEFVVYPRRGRIDFNRLIPRVHSAARGGQRRVTVRHPLDGADVHGLRPFRTGDSPRWIHWKTTARIGDLMVREFDRAAGPSLSVAVDPRGQTPGGWEASLSFVTSLVAAWATTQDGRLAILLPRGNTFELLELGHRRNVHEILTKLAEWSVEAPLSLGPPDLSRLPEGRPVLTVGRGPTVMVADRGAGPGRRPVVGRLDPGVESEWYRPPEVDDDTK